jgi:hypothetical protein
MYISHMAAAIAEGSCLLRAVWLQCDHRVLTATHEFWCNQRRLLQGVQAQALHGISHVTLHTPAALFVAASLFWL